MKQVATSPLGESAVGSDPVYDCGPKLLTGVIRCLYFTFLWLRISYTPHILPPLYLLHIFNVFIILDYLGLPYLSGSEQAEAENPELLQGRHLRPRWPWLAMCGVERGTGLTVLFILLPAVMATSLLIHRRGQPNSKKHPWGLLQPSNVLGFLKPVYPHWGRAWSCPHSDQGGPEVGPSEPGPLPFPWWL